MDHQGRTSENTISMTEEEVYTKLVKQSPTGYRLNEIIPFSYPVRRLKIDVLVNKQPDGSLVKVYAVILSAIQSGLSEQKALFEFLGLSDTDEFILRELFYLKEKGYLNLVSEKWIVEDAGNTFLKNNAILRIEDEEEFEFLVDEINGDILSANDNPRSKVLPKKLSKQLTFGKRDKLLIEDKFQALADTYKNDHDSKAYLIGYSREEIKNDWEEFCNYWLIEYVPERTNGEEAKLEVRSYDSLKLVKHLTEKFNSEYKHYIYELTESDRVPYSEITDQPEIINPILTPISKIDFNEFKTLAIWETKSKFIEALKSVKQRILIESPWIRKATLEYIPLFEEILKRKKQLVILYGISEKDEHDHGTLKRILELQQQHKEHFHLIHLPTHFEKLKSCLTGTHRKLVIKDNDYYIAGSFNFLSFGKNEKQQVANEESMLISHEVDKKWRQVLHEYSLKF